MAKLSERIKSGSTVTAGFTRGELLGTKKCQLTLVLISVTCDPDNKYMFFMFQVLHSKDITFNGATENNFVPGQLVTHIANLEATEKFIQGSITKLTKIVADILGFEGTYEWDDAYTTPAAYKAVLGTVYGINSINQNLKATSGVKYYVNIKAFKDTATDALLHVSNATLPKVFEARALPISPDDIAAALTAVTARKAHNTTDESTAHDDALEATPDDEPNFG